MSPDDHEATSRAAGANLVGPKCVDMVVALIRITARPELGEMRRPCFDTGLGH